jgi:hypothetical protein
MRHDVNSGAFVRVGVEAKDTSDPKRSVYDLHQKYQDLSLVVDAPGAAPVHLPIDVEVITPFHLAQNRVPGLFMPRVQEKAAAAAAKMRSSSAKRK